MDRRVSFFMKGLGRAGLLLGTLGASSAVLALDPAHRIFHNQFGDLAAITGAGGVCKVGTADCGSSVLTAGEIGFPQIGGPVLSFPVINAADSTKVNIDKQKGTIRFNYRPLAGSNVGDWNLTPPTDGNWSGYNPAQKVLFRLYDADFSNLASLKIGTFYDPASHRNYLYFRYDGSNNCNPGFGSSGGLPPCAREVSAIAAEPDLLMGWQPDTVHSVVASWDFTGSAPFMAISVDGVGGENRSIAAPDISGFDPSEFFVGSNVGSAPAQGRIDNLEIYDTPLDFSDPVASYIDRTHNDGVWQPHETLHNSTDAPPALALSGQPFVFFNSYAYERIDEGHVPASATDAAGLTVDVAKNQYETAFFNIYAGASPLGTVTASVSSLSSGTSTIAQSDIRIRTVKNWWQAGTQVERNLFVPVYTPELLVYDNTTSLHCTGSSSTNPCANMQFPSDPHTNYTVTQVATNTSRQFAVTLHIPANTPAGTYSGTITVATSAGTKTLPIHVVVHDFALPEIDKIVSVYNGSRLTTPTEDAYVSPTYFKTLQAPNMREHGITGLLFGGEDELQPDLYPDAAWDAQLRGFAAYPYFTNNPPLTTAEQSRAVALVQGIAQAGFADAYLYGDDEPTSSTGNMDKHLAQSAAIHAACTTGLTPNRCGKVVVAITKDWADKLNDPSAYPLVYKGVTYPYTFAQAKLDLPNLAAETNWEPTTVAYFDALLSGDHSVKPNRPELYYWQMYREEPRINRFYTGYHLWLTDLAGVMPYVDRRVVGNPYDDFSAAAANERDTVAMYPSLQGNIDTIEWEAFRAGLDDYRLLQLWISLMTELAPCAPVDAMDFAYGLESLVSKYRSRTAFSSVSRAAFAADRKALIDMIDDIRDALTVPACRHGLTGRYFNSTTPGGTPAASQVDEQIDFDWVMASPIPGTVNTDNFSISWTGRLVPPVTGTYEFCTSSDDGVQLAVNAQTVVDKWVDQAVTTWCGTVDLAEGEPVPIALDFYDIMEEAVVKLTWSYPGQSTHATVPSSALYAE